MGLDCRGWRLWSIIFFRSKKQQFSIIAVFKNLAEKIIFSFVQLYADFHGASAADQGLLLSFRNIISFSGQQLFGRASDRYGRIIVLVGGFLTAMISSLMLVRTITPWGIIIIFAFYSLGFSAIQPSFNALIGDNYSNNQRTEAIGFIGAVGSLIGGLSYLLVGLFSDTFENPYIFLFTTAAVSFLCAAIAVLVINRISPSPRVNNGNRVKVSIFDPLKYRFFRRFVIIDALFAFSMSTSWPLFPSKTNELANTTQVTLMWTLVFVLMSISAKYAHRIKTRINAYNKALFISRALLWTVPLTFFLATNWVHLLLGRIFAGLTFGAYITFQKDYILESVNLVDRDDSKGLFIGAHAMVFGLATFVGSMFMGKAVDYILENELFNLTFDSFFMISAIFRFLAAFLFLLVPDIMSPSTSIE